MCQRCPYTEPTEGGGHNSYIQYRRVWWSETAETGRPRHQSKYPAHEHHKIIMQENTQKMVLGKVYV